MKGHKFEGIIPAFVTPLQADNRTVNVQVARDLLEYQLAQGADGFYILGATGEGLVMDREQREILCETAVQQVNGRKPIICHIASMNLPEAMALAKHAEKAGADAIASVPPFYFSYSETDIFNYYKTLADCVSIPLIIYYHPAAQKEMRANLIAKLYEIDNITGVKWSSTDLYQMMLLKDKTHGEMNIINGPDEILVSGLTAGADAGIGTNYNIMLPQFVEIYKHFKNGDIAQAAAAQRKVNRVIEVMLRNPLIPAVKYATTLMGFPVGNATYPMCQFSDEQKTNLERELAQVGWPFTK